MKKAAVITEKIHDFQNFMAGYHSAVWLAGCSGGADSCALLLLLKEAAELEKAKLKCVYFEHHLRGSEGEKDGDFVQELCRKNNIPFQKIELDLSGSSGSIEAAAREARLAGWKKLSGENHGAAVILAHHAGDRRENLILRLMRGANVSGLTSLRKTAYVNGILILRPLLDFERSELEEFLHSRGVEDWRNDWSNADENYDRNFIRNTFFRRFPGKRFDRAIQSLTIDADFIETMAERERHFFKDKDAVPAAEWLRLHPALRHRVLRHYLSGKLGSDFLPGNIFCGKFNDLISGKLKELPIPDSSFVLCRKEDNIAVIQKPETAPPVPEKTGNWQDGELNDFFDFKTVPDYRIVKLPPDQAAFSLELFPRRLEYSPPRPGEKMRVFPSGREEKLKKLRIDAKAPPGYPVLRNADTGEVLWYPGVRHSNAALPENGSEAVILSLKMLDKPLE